MPWSDYLVEGQGPQRRWHQRFDCETSRGKWLSDFHQPTKMRFRRIIVSLLSRGTTLNLLLLVFVSPGIFAATNNFLTQTITFPSNVTTSRFASLNNTVVSDLLALDPVEKRILIYRQRSSGFTNIPDQVIALPQKTAW